MYRNRGFSIIELLVAISILSVIMGLSIASYTSYQKTQLVTSAAYDLATNLRYLQSQASAGVKQGACADPNKQLIGWYINGIGNSYVLRITCAPPASIPSLPGGDLGTATIQDVKTITLPSSVRVNPNGGYSICFVFQPANKGVGSCALNPGVLGSDVGIVVSDAQNVSNKKTVTIKQSGDIQVQ